MPADAVLAAMRRLSLRASAWPPLLRDLAAASLALWSVCIGELLILVLPLPPEALLAIPGALLAWWSLGWLSAGFALLLAALAVHMIAGDRASALSGAGANEALGLLALGAALVASCLGARIWARTRERRASLLLDACAQDALGRIAEANARLTQAEAEAATARARLAEAEAALAKAQRAAVDAAHPLAVQACRDPAFEAALRSEGGI
jgi:hypothetical protein